MTATGYLLAYALPVGAGATAVMDLWGMVLKWLFGVPAPDYALVGRWIAHMPRGRFLHERIAASPAIKNERLIGWVAHYLVGIAFAALLLSFSGVEWIRNPTLGPALTIGIGGIIAPFFLMQPGMGAGIAASRTPRPNATRLRSLVTHTVFGLGLYAAGSALNLLPALR